MRKEYYEESVHTTHKSSTQQPRLLIGSPEDGGKEFNLGNGRLSGIYENYLLIRPYPNLRILFASPSLRVPGILQSPFLNKIGGSLRVRDELSQALADGRGVTAKVRWISGNTEGRSRWIHCTPLLGSNGAIGVWMVLVIDDESPNLIAKGFKQAPPIERHVPFNGRDNGGSRPGTRQSHRENGNGNGSVGSFVDVTERNGSMNTFRIS